MSAPLFLSNPPLLRRFPWEQGFNEKYPWELTGELRYQSDVLGGIISVPAGFKTDFASIPWFFRRTMPKDGLWTHAAIIHDWLCIQRDPKINSKMAAKIFEEAMTLCQVPKWTHKMMYRAVVTCGPNWP